jgi:uncharacterized membrane protein YcaP (DUF421 family)
MENMMEQIFGVHWHDTFVPDTPLIEIFIRGSLVYLIIFLLLRMFRRGSGAVGISDILVLVLIADAAQNAMASNYTSLPDGILLVATIIFWSFFLDWLGYRSPRIRRFTYPDPLPLMLNGQRVGENLRHVLITDTELESHFRLQGIENIARVKNSYVEGDGRISVIEQEEHRHEEPEREVG